MEGQSSQQPQGQQQAPGGQGQQQEVRQQVQQQVQQSELQSQQVQQSVADQQQVCHQVGASQLNELTRDEFHAKVEKNVHDYLEAHGEKIKKNIDAQNPNANEEDKQAIFAATSANIYAKFFDKLVKTHYSEQAIVDGSRTMGEIEKAGNKIV